MRLQTTPIVSSSNATTLGWGAGTLGASTTIRYLYPWYGDQLAEVVETGLVIPRPGVVRNLYVHHTIPSGNGGVISYRVRVSGVDAAVTVALASTSPSGSDTSNAVAVTTGDVVSIKVEKASNVDQSPRNIVVTAELI
jgi:hypothetical protein